MCDSPLVALRLGTRKSNGKNIIKLYRDSSRPLSELFSIYGKENVLLIPCGKCPSCLLKRRKEWAVRCACEAKDHQYNCFVTLTYDAAHLPAGSKGAKEDAIKFIKSIRNSGSKVRYFGCVERGGNTLRLHSHFVLFGFMPFDLVYEKDTDSGFALYSSKLLSSLWKKGIVTVQLFQPGVAGYVAGYTSKKLGDPDSCQFMSTKPGIGFNYIEKHKDIFLKYGSLFEDFGYWNTAAIPRYFKKVLEKNGYGFYLDLLNEQSLKSATSALYEKARLHGFNSIEPVVFYDKNIHKRKLEKLERGL